jgi:YndJ-like protein
MTAVELLFAVVLVGAVPLALARIQLGDSLADRSISGLRPVAWPAAIAVAGATLAAPGPVAVALALPWQAVTGLLAIVALVAVLRNPGRWLPDRRLAVAISLGFLAFGAANATSFASGFAPLGFAPTIVLLTAVHFHTAGFVVMTAGILAADRGSRRSAGVGVAAVAIGSAITAAGFLGVPGAAVVGAVVVAVGGLLIGWATVRVGPALRSRWARRLTTIAGLALFVSMPLAIAWAVGTAVGLPPFDLDLMIRTHGTINALVVAVPAMAGWALDARSAPLRVGDR